jgi:hypothetical protein
MEFWEAVEELNSLTENRFGSGPLSDMDARGATLRRKAYMLALKTYPTEYTLPDIKRALGL